MIHLNKRSRIMLNRCTRSFLEIFTISLFIVLVVSFYPKISIAKKAENADRVVREKLTADLNSAEQEQVQSPPEAGSFSDSPGDKGEHGVSIKKENELQFDPDAAMDLVEAAREYWVEGDPDKALEALDQAYALIAAMPADEAELAQEKEDLRLLIAKRVLEIHASRYITAKGTNKAIPLIMNKHVEREIQLFKNKERRFFLDAYKRSGQFRGEIVKALKKAGLPEELSWLPLIESGFKVKAFSRARALGLWQFIPSTGRKFGLQRTNWVDERMDPEKSTAAAIAYFKELHSIFGDWATVLAAYNCGEGTVLRAIRRQKFDYLDDFWDLYPRLPGETARYYPRFLAVLAILKDPARYGITLDEPDPGIVFEVVPVQKQLHLRTLAKNIGVPFDKLALLNPELRRHVTPVSPYSLKVPVGKGVIAVAALDKLPQSSVKKRRYVLHSVKKGENLSFLALKYHTSIRAIENTNRLRRDQLLQVGLKLKIPQRGTSI
jgi:membrane-bound lytic murein transglycosylase D